jgi:hypothetical protein
MMKEWSRKGVWQKFDGMEYERSVGEDIYILGSRVSQNFKIRSERKAAPVAVPRALDAELHAIRQDIPPDTPVA